MKLLRVKISSAETCGGFLDGFDISLRRPVEAERGFEPICLIGPNGCGKSQFLQVIAEIFQAIFHAFSSSEERLDGNPSLQFEIEYVIWPIGQEASAHVRIARSVSKGRKSTIVIDKKVEDEWIRCDLKGEQIVELLPSKVVGYTSGDNETLSLPFLLSRGGYAKDVYGKALSDAPIVGPIPDTRLMLIDYSTHLEVLAANLLLGDADHRSSLLADAHLEDIHSLRCVVQLAHGAVPAAPKRRRAVSARKGIQLTDELEASIDRLKRCATCYDHDPKIDAYTFDFLVTKQTRIAFSHFWDNVLELYSVFHKLAMLNDLAISKTARKRFETDTKQRRFASRLPEPTDDDKVFRFEQVNFRGIDTENIVDYVSLSDGEHQLAQLLGTFCMVSFTNVLFLLDEPESHFNPQWRVKFVSKLLDLPTATGSRRDEKSGSSKQDCLLTTHAPFVASDTPRDRVFIFAKDQETRKITVRHPDFETYGTTFDSILEECFGVCPPISQVSREEIDELMQSDDLDAIREGMKRLGSSVEKAFLADRVRQLSGEEGQ